MSTPTRCKNAQFKPILVHIGAMRVHLDNLSEATGVSRQKLLRLAVRRFLEDIGYRDPLPESMNEPEFIERLARGGPVDHRGEVRVFCDVANSFTATE